MATVRACSECGTPLRSKAVTAKTCSNKCRNARHRRLGRAERAEREFEKAHGAGAREVAEIVRREGADVIGRVVKEELHPIVREALTEDVLRAVQGMLNLTPRAVELLADDLESPDATIRQRAYTLVTKYTIGHPALLQAKDTEAGQQMVVNFNLPRPEPEPDAPSLTHLEELVTCDSCGVTKPASEFAAGSERCNECFAAWKRTILEQFS